MKIAVIYGILAIACFSCTDNHELEPSILEPQPVEIQNDIFIYEVEADSETEPVSALLGQDAADDPCLWINKSDRNKSTIIGTNKTSGLEVYNLDGESLFFYPVGRVNNVDIRYGFDLNGTAVDIVAASNRSTNCISLFMVQPESGELKNIEAEPMVSELNEVYGICMHKNIETNQFYVFINGRSGEVEQWLLNATSENKISGKIVRRFALQSKTEGMVADDEKGYVYIGEENRGIWKYSTNTEDTVTKTLIDLSGEDNPRIQYDVEGLSMYYAENGNGYLLASIQGNSTYAVFERKGDNTYLGSFAIVDGEIDGAEETDGIDVCNVAFGQKFPKGVFIVQDGFNYYNETEETQNFKMVSWEKIAQKFDPPLLIDTIYNPYFQR